MFGRKMEVQFSILDYFAPIKKREVPRRSTLKKYMPPVLGWDRLKPLPEKFTSYPGNNNSNHQPRKISISPSMDPLILDGRPIAIDLFSGAGGFSFGIILAGFRVIASVEFDYWAHVTYCANIPLIQMAPLHCYSCDIKEITDREILMNAGVTEVDLIVGGPPCQSFSYVGKRKVGDERDNLLFHYARIIKEIQPKFWIMENVPGMKTKKNPDGRKVIDCFMEYINKRNECDFQSAITKSVLEERKQSSGTL